MPLIVDTFNVLHVVGVLPPDRAGIDLRELATLIRGSRWRDDEVILVCDGRRQPEDPEPSPRLDIRYSGPGRTADEVIETLIAAAPDPRRVTVVSSDRAIIRAARRRRCRPVASDTFLGQLLGDVEGQEVREARPDVPLPPPVLKPGQVEGWRSVFGVDESTVDELVAETTSPAPAREPEEEGEEPPAARVEPGGPLLPPKVIEEAERLLGNDEDT